MLWERPCQIFSIDKRDPVTSLHNRNVRTLNYQFLGNDSDVLMVFLDAKHQENTIYEQPKGYFKFELDIE